MLLSVCLIVLTIFFLKYHWKRRKFYYLSWKMNGPIALPIIGNAHLFWNASEIIETFTKLCEKYKTPFRFWLGNRFLIIFDRPEYIEGILTSKHAAEKGDLYKFVEKCMGGEGIFSSQGKNWQTHRKLLNPTIQNYNILISFYPIFNENIKILIDRLNDKVGNGEFDVYDYLEACTFDIVCETTFGTRMNIQKEQNLGFLKNVNNVAHIMSLMLQQPWYQIDPIFKLSKYNEILKDNYAGARQFMSKLLFEKIENYKIQVKNGLNGKLSMEDNAPKQQNIFIDECLRLGLEKKCFTIEDMLVESATMMTGGFETTATTVSYIVLMLAMFPKYQQKVFEELKTIFPNQNTDVSPEDLGKLDYTDRFVKETLRLFPTVPIVTRCPSGDLEIEKLKIPAKSELCISYFNLHRNKDIWGPNADQFNPDNFLPENISQRRQHSFSPYGIGPRNCIGLKYANQAIRIFTCWLVRNYYFTTNLKMSELQYRMSITLKLENKHLVCAHRRSVY